MGLEATTTMAMNVGNEMHITKDENGNLHYWNETAQRWERYVPPAVVGTTYYTRGGKTYRSVNGKEECLFDGAGEYQASCKEIEACAALVTFYGDGATIRAGHTKESTVWTEGEEDHHADESYDGVVETVMERIKARLDLRAKRASQGGRDTEAARRR